jgi:hypothetical protein
MPKQNKKKSRTYSWWKNKTHDDYKRMRRLQETDEYGYGICVSCRNKFPFKETQAGHFKHGLDFVYHNYNIQCGQCNYFGARDSHNAYTLWMIDKHGRECVDNLMSRKTYLYKIPHFQAMRKVIRKIIKRLENEKMQVT